MPGTFESSNCRLLQDWLKPVQAKTAAFPPQEEQNLGSEVDMFAAGRIEA